MKTKLPFVLVATITASLAYAAINYAAGPSPAAASTRSSSSLECCDPLSPPAQ